MSNLFVHEGGGEEITKGTTAARVIEILGEPQGRTTFGQVYDKHKGPKVLITPEGAIPGGIPSGMDDEYWLYTFQDVEYTIVIRSGKVSEIKRYAMK